MDVSLERDSCWCQVLKVKAVTLSTADRTGLGRVYFSGTFALEFL